MLRIAHQHRPHAQIDELASGCWIRRVIDKVKAAMDCCSELESISRFPAVAPAWARRARGRDISRAHVW